MPTYFETSNIINTNADGVDMAADDNLFIAAGVTVAGGTEDDEDGASSTGGDIFAQVLGTLWGGDYGLAIGSTGVSGENQVVIGTAGSVIGNLDAGISLAGGNNTVTNSGLVSGEFNAVDATAGGNTIDNSGLMTGIDAGIVLEGANNTIANGGRIVASGGNAVNLTTTSGLANTIDNTGVVEALDPADDAVRDTGSGTLNITNSGHVLGGISVAGAASIANQGTIVGVLTFDTASTTTVTIDNAGAIGIAAADAIAIQDSGSGFLDITNSGHISGGISFGSGTNVYDGALGSVSGEVTGGSGYNMFTGGAGHDNFDGGSGTSVLDGMGGNDLLEALGNQATIDGGDGNDTIVMPGSFNASDQIDGGSGRDTLVLRGDYSAGVVLGPDTLTNVERITVEGGNSYKLTMDDNNVAAGARMVVDGSTLGSADTLTFNGAAETDGRYMVTGGAGNDVLTGGAGNDVLNGGIGKNVFDGGGGADRLSGGGNADTFVYTDASDSTGASHDIITGFNTTNDKFDLDVTVTGIDTTVASGRLTAANFDTNLTNAISAAHLAAGHAVLYTPTLGGFAGHVFLIVDANGVAGYQAGQDYVFDLVGAAHLNTLATSDFI